MIVVVGDVDGRILWLVLTDCVMQAMPVNFIGKESQIKFSGIEVYCTNALILLMGIMLCSKLHCQKF